MYHTTCHYISLRDMYICIKTDGNKIQQVRIIWGREEISIGKDIEEALAVFIISYFLNIILFLTFTLFFKPFICLKDFIIIFFNMACIFPITFKQQTGKRKIASWLCHIQFFCDSRLKKTPTTDTHSEMLFYSSSTFQKTQGSRLTSMQS